MAEVARGAAYSNYYTSMSQGFGLPGRIRVDNEACFNSRLLKVALGLLNVCVQAIQLHCPWMVGKAKKCLPTGCGQ